jgi:flagellar hook-associated protein 1 FlgK
MSLTSSLQIGNSALNAAQLAIQVVGNNMANAATPGYSRQIAFMQTSLPDGTSGMSLGTGVHVSGIRRQVDEALQARLWNGTSQEAGAQQQSNILSQIEGALGELGDASLSKQLSTFFNTWSERANLTKSSAVVVQQGKQLSDFIRKLRNDLTDQKTQIDNQVGVQVQKADGALTKIAELNTQIAAAETGGGESGSLRDQRDSLITELSQYMDVTAVDQGNGFINILVGSTPVVLGGHSRGIELKRESAGNGVSISVNLKDDGQSLDIQSGQIGASIANRSAAIDSTVDKLDTIASQLIFQVNKLHSTGTNADWLTSASAQLSIPAADRTRSLNDPANGTLAALPFHAVNGGFTVNVKSSTGATQAIRINVDLDGLDSTGAAGFSNDSSAQSIASAIDAIDGVSASIGPDGKLKLSADTGFSFAMSDDSSGALAVLGVNSYFTGTSASDINVRQDLTDTPSQLMVGRLTATGFVENASAMQISQLQNMSIAALGNQSITKSWLDSAQSLGVQTDAAKAIAEAASTVREGLEAQRAAISGVSVDEESVNLLTFQRQYQGAAKFVSVVDQMTQTLISLV